MPARPDRARGGGGDGRLAVAFIQHFEALRSRACIAVWTLSRTASAAHGVVAAEEKRDDAEKGWDEKDQQEEPEQPPPVVLWKGEVAPVDYRYRNSADCIPMVAIPHDCPIWPVG